MHILSPYLVFGMFHQMIINVCSYCDMFIVDDGLCTLFPQCPVIGVGSCNFVELLTILVKFG